MLIGTQQILSKNYKLACWGKQTAKDDSVILGTTTVACGITEVWVNAITLLDLCAFHISNFLTRSSLGLYFSVTGLAHFILLVYILKLIKLLLVRNLYSTEM